MATKAYSKGAKRRAKRAAAQLPGLAETPKRQPNGQRRDRADAPTDPRKTALQARVRHFGGEDTKHGRNAMSGQHNGSQMGMVLHYMLKEDRASKLWQTFAGWCAAENAYRRRYLGATEFAKGAAIAMVPDGIQTDTGHTVDLRGADEKDRDAINGWMRWQGNLGHLAADQRALLQAARIEAVTLWRDQRPTAKGRAAKDALEALYLVVEKRG